MAKRVATGRVRVDRARQQHDADEVRARRARRNRRAAMARARAAGPNGRKQSAERAALIEQFLTAFTRYPIQPRNVEWVATAVSENIARDTGLLLSTRTIRRHAERLGLVAKHRMRR